MGIFRRDFLGEQEWGSSGTFDVAVAENSTVTQGAFGEQIIAQLHQVVDLRFPHDRITSQAASTSTNGTGAVDVVARHARAATGTDADGSGIISSVRFLRYRTGQGGLVRFTAIFTPGVSSSRQIVGYGDGDDGLYVGFNGATFGILRRANNVDTWVAQADWSVDPMDGSGPSGQTLDTTKGNVYQIRFQWLGYGMITFSVEDSSTGSFRVVHQIKYANLYTATSITNPSMPLRIEATNLGNTTNLSVQCPSMAAFIEGTPQRIGNVFGSQQVLTGVTTAQVVLSVQNATEINSVKNRTPISPTLISLANEGNKTCQWRVYRDAVAPVGAGWSQVSAGQSVAFVASGITLVSSGELVFGISLGKSSSFALPIDSFNMFVVPSGNITVTAQSNASSDVSASLSWHED